MKYDGGKFIFSNYLAINKDSHPMKTSTDVGRLKNIGGFVNDGSE